MSDKKLIGIDLGGTTIKLAILTENGEIQQGWSLKTDILNDGSHIIPDIIGSINEHLNLYNMKPEQFIGIGMGAPGSVDRKLGTVTDAYNLSWTTIQYVKRDIERGTKIKLAIDNDANVAALGEQWKGAGDNESDVTFITLGTGVGGGIIANGQLLHGVAGSAGEIGHMTIAGNKFICTCGKRGCLETVASATGVVRLSRYMAEEYAGPSKLKKILDSGGEVTSKIVFDLAKDKDPFANMVIQKVCYYLGLATANIANILNPKYIVIGGGVSAAGDFLIKNINRYFLENTFSNVRKTTELRLATLGNMAGVIGAASLALKFKK